MFKKVSQSQKKTKRGPFGKKFKEKIHNAEKS